MAKYQGSFKNLRRHLLYKMATTQLVSLESLDTDVVALESFAVKISIILDTTLHLILKK